MLQDREGGYFPWKLWQGLEDVVRCRGKLVEGAGHEGKAWGSPGGKRM